MGKLDVHITHGGGGGRDLGPVLIVAAVVLLLAAGAGKAAGAIAAMMVAVLAGLGVILLAVTVAVVFWLRGKAARDAAFMRQLEADRQERKTAVEDKFARRAAITAAAQAQAMAPVLAAYAAAVRPEPPQPQPVHVVRGQVEP